MYFSFKFPISCPLIYDWSLYVNNIFISLSPCYRVCALLFRCTGSLNILLIKDDELLTVTFQCMCMWNQPLHIWRHFSKLHLRTLITHFLILFWHTFLEIKRLSISESCKSCTEHKNINFSSQSLFNTQNPHQRLKTFNSWVQQEGLLHYSLPKLVSTLLHRLDTSKPVVQFRVISWP